MNILRIFPAMFITVAIGLSSLAWGDEAPKKNWKDSAEVSIVSTNGNSKASSASGKDTFSYKWSKSTLDLFASALKSEAKGVTTAEKYNAGEKFEYDLSPKNYAYQRFVWDKDRFSGIRNRYDSSVGLGRELIATPQDNLIAELGAGYIVEERIGSQTNDFPSSRAFGKYVRKISKTSDFSQTVEYIQNLKFGDDFRINTESALTAVVSTHVSMKLSYLWNYVAQPPTGFGRNDTTTTVALVVDY